jgi:outer membrane protein
MKAPVCGGYKIVGLILIASGLLPLPAAGQTYLDSCIQDGLKNNLKIQQRKVAAEQAGEFRNIAKSYLLPAVNVQGAYTSGEGGRTISIPAGDLLNPVYSTLNNLTSSSQFSSVANTNENFIPKDFFDAKIRTVIPLLNNEMKYEKNISELKVTLAQTDVVINKRQLVFEIKSAYFTLLSLNNMVRVYDSTLAIANRIVKINASLYKNGKMLYANYLRSQNEAGQVQAQLDHAVSQLANAKMYFNYLLNRDVNSEVQIDAGGLDAGLLFDPAAKSSSTREELKIFRVQKQIDLFQVKRAQSFRIPRISAVIDAGPQTKQWKFDSKAWYYQVSVQFSVPLYNGSKNLAEIKQKKLQARQMDLDEKNTAALLNLAVLTATNELKTAKNKYAAAVEQVKTANSYYRVVEKTYKEGITLLSELLDARNQLTAAWLQELQGLFEVSVAAAKLERETASYKIEN